MPRENKQRGRRGDKKRKLEENSKDVSSKRRRSTPEDGRDGHDEGGIIVHGDAGGDFIGFGVRPEVTEAPFLGLLAQEDQDYYANVNNKLTLNDFETREDRSEFIDAVYRESNGKELRIASSQSSSRYLEIVIMLSNPQQLKGLFQKFLGNFTHLVQHRFASHCCEALFLNAAPAVGNEREASAAGQDATEVTMEHLFLQVVDELKPNLGYLLTERFASHVIRVLLLVLSGEPLSDGRSTALLASRRKEKVETKLPSWHTATSEERVVPKSFLTAVNSMIAAATSTLGTTYLRALATHPTGNPMLQLLLQLELKRMRKNGHNKGEHSVLWKLLPDETLEDGSEGAKFLQGIVYDPTGSRLVETIVEYAPGKLFKMLYKNILQDRMGSMAKNDTASYAVIKIMERMSKEALDHTMTLILPEIPALVARNRVNVIRTMVERGRIRQADMKPLAESLREAYGNDATAMLPKILRLDTAPDQDENDRTTKDGKSTKKRKPQAVDLHGSLLAQTMLQTPATCDIIYESLLALPVELLILLAKDSTASRIIQSAITCETSTVSFRRQLIPFFFGHMSELATNSAASHLADALWDGTNGSHFMKERLAKELQENETVVRESRYGRSVWKNWSMDLYQRRFLDWQAQAKGFGFGESAKENAPNKSGIELARARFAERKASGFRQKGRPSTVSANA
jgi:nucleolar protein 9